MVKGYPIPMFFDPTNRLQPLFLPPDHHVTHYGHTLLSLKNDFLGLNGGSSDQHVVIGKEYRNKNEADLDNTVEFFRSRNIFDTSRTALLNIVTGIEADSSVNVHHTKSIGNKIVEKAVGCMVKSYKFKRVDQAITMGSKIKRQDGTVQEVDPQELFDRLINLAFVCSSSSVSDRSFKFSEFSVFLLLFPALRLIRSSVL